MHDYANIVEMLFTIRYWLSLYKSSFGKPLINRSRNQGKNEIIVLCVDV